ncbi:Structure-specific endonuclease subunit SLX4 [Trichoderma simmonsii]|uniref:Structure-specific endonuclease subunit SLX4 n=1 Tax=Trichoderma simmonsii TaxID=1491479 RepID=A0A8G0L997_9HYPO|nr:Structure-specific endonuclease subunit SLX4 [Trichoderma simmonsii]
MASPNAFLLSPSQRANQKSRFFRSSSPDLPAVGDILSPNAKIRSLKHGNQALVISDDEETDIKKADSKEYTEPLPFGPTPSVSARSRTMEPDDSSLLIIEPPTTHTPEARRHHATPPKFRAKSSSPVKDERWKMFKSKADSSKSDIDEAIPMEIDTVEPPSAQQPTFDPSSPAIRTKSTRAEHDITEPLMLEAATVRRLDWTPPSNKTSTILPLHSPTIDGLHSPGEAQEESKSFEQILEAYKCTMDNLQQDVSIPSDEDSSILRKRKLVELVTTSAATIEPPPGVKTKAPKKQKAPKKKPRTLTEIATSAYRVPDASESAPLISDDDATSTTKESDAPTAKGKSKAKPRKRISKGAAKQKKKATPPPRPILLPPTEALQEVARQDFVFGTSSQLAIENSPTFLRELHAAMRRSNQTEYIDLDTTLNSDDIEPPERKRLWAAAARDVDGDLFDLEMSRIIERSSQLLPVVSDDDPFGYTGADRKMTVSAVSVNGVDTSLQTESLIDSTVVPQHKNIEPIEILDEGSMLIGSDISTGSPIQRRTKSPAKSQPIEPNNPCKDSDPQQSEHPASKPSFELFTDAQLSKEIASYGFKAVKSRQAKISLLEQCWQGKNQLEHPGSKRTLTTSAATAGNATNNEVKTPRGRPRKNSASSPEVHEPPPSAQAPVSPLKRRGRPKKAASTTKRTTASTSKGKKVSTETAEEASTARKRKPAAAKVVVEIPDSESDSDLGMSPNPSSSPESGFSPPPAVDLSLSLMDDTDPSLVLNSTQDRSLSYEYITKAVKSAPRTTDPANPSWHEKMLLYDPIVLEDFTTWLNCGQLTRVGFDGEVSTMEVKQWCESKSICCLWKVNLRGKERKRF